MTLQQFLRVYPLRDYFIHYYFCIIVDLYELHPYEGMLAHDLKASCHRFLEKEAELFTSDMLTQLQRSNCQQLKNKPFVLIVKTQKVIS